MREITIKWEGSDYLPIGLFKWVTKVETTPEIEEFFKNKVGGPVNLVAEIGDDSDTELWLSDAALFQTSFDQACALLGHIGGDFWKTFEYSCLIFIGAVEFNGEIRILTAEKAQRNFPFSVKLDLKPLDTDWELFDEIFSQVFHVFATAVQDKKNPAVLIPT